MSKFPSHEEQIMNAAVSDVFGRDLDTIEPWRLEAVLSGYAGALDAIGGLR